METYLTVQELAGHLKLGKQSIRRWVYNREIPYHKIKKVIRFRLSEIENWVDNGAETPTPEKGFEAGAFDVNEADAELPGKFIAALKK